MDQLEFIDISRDRTRPPGGGQVIGVHFIYNTIPQRPDQVAYSIGCCVQQVYDYIHEGLLPNAYDISSDGAGRPCYRIPRQDVIDFLASRKEGA